MPAMKYEIRRKCPICGVVFRIKTIDSVYCSPACSKVACKRKADREAHEKKLDEFAKKMVSLFICVVYLKFCRKVSPIPNTDFMVNYATRECINETFSS